LIAFGLSIVEDEPYRRFAGPGLTRAAEPDSLVLAFSSVGAMPRTYNLVLAEAARHDELEALVLVQSHVEIVDERFCAKVRELMGEPGVAVAGCVGATGPRSLAWWRGTVRSGRIRQHYHEHGEGEIEGLSLVPPGLGPGEVDVVDGRLMVLSPWAVRNLRFDETLLHGYGFDVDLCLRAREAGRRVLVGDLQVLVHEKLEPIREPELWVEAHQRLAERWEGRWPGAQPDERSWRERARRAEAEREAARATAFSSQLAADVRVLALEKAMEEATGTVSWRLTEPLRRLNKARRDRRARRARSGLEAAPAPDPAAVQDESQPSPQRLQAVHRARAKRD